MESIKISRRQTYLAAPVIFSLFLVGCSQQSSQNAAPNSNTPISRDIVPPPSDPATLVTPAEIENTDQISKENFDKIKNGMSLREVELIILGTSRLVTSKSNDGKTSETYRWETADASKYIEVSFVDEKVVGKNQKGLK